MKSFIVFFCLFLILGCQNNSPKPSIEEEVKTNTSPKAKGKQLILVTAENSTTHLGTVRWYEWAENKWLIQGEPVSCTLGKNGMAWGLGLHENPSSVILKEEGDGKTPKGIFNAGEAFGYSSKANFQYPYAQITEFTQCIEDTTSAQYNKIIDRSKIEKDWESADNMLRKDHLYRLGFFVEHNLEQKVAAGSCIFFHNYRAVDKPTAGCTGMAEKDLERLLSWMDVRKEIKIVQVAKEDISFLTKQIQLPEFKDIVN